MTHSNETTGVAFRPRFKTGTAHSVAEDQAAHGPIVVLVWHELLLNDGSDYTVSSKGAYSLQCGALAMYCGGGRVISRLFFSNPCAVVRAFRSSALILRNLAVVCTPCVACVDL